MRLQCQCFVADIFLRVEVFGTSCDMTSCIYLFWSFQAVNEQKKVPGNFVGIAPQCITLSVRPSHHHEQSTISYDSGLWRAPTFPHRPEARGKATALEATVLTNKPTCCPSLITKVRKYDVLFSNKKIFALEIFSPIIEFNELSYKKYIYFKKMLHYSTTAYTHVHLFSILQVNEANVGEAKKKNLQPLLLDCKWRGDAGIIPILVT